MSLRLRLIVAFFLFSVVPLAAVTFYSYAGNVRALQRGGAARNRDAHRRADAAHAGGDDAISDRVEHLMDMPVTARRTAAGTSGTTAAPPRTVLARSTPARTRRRRGAAAPPRPHRRPLLRRPQPSSSAPRSIRKRSSVRSPARSARSRCCSTTSRCADSAECGGIPRRGAREDAAVAPGAADGSLAARGRGRGRGDNARTETAGTAGAAGWRGTSGSSG